jgi:hypothetical protein
MCLQSLQHQMNDFKYHYLFTSFDLETFEIEDFRYNFVNITAFRLVDTSDVFVKEMMKEMQQFGRQHNIRLKKNLAIEVSNESFFISLRAIFSKRNFFHLSKLNLSIRIETRLYEEGIGAITVLQFFFYIAFYQMMMMIKRLHKIYKIISPSDIFNIFILIRKEKEMKFV